MEAVRYGTSHLAEEFGVGEPTVRYWLRTIEQHTNFVFPREGKYYLLHEKDLDVVRQFREYCSRNLRIDVAAIVSVMVVIEGKPEPTDFSQFLDINYFDSELEPTIISSRSDKYLWDLVQRNRRSVVEVIVKSLPHEEQERILIEVLG